MADDADALNSMMKRIDDGEAGADGGDTATPTTARAAKRLLKLFSYPPDDSMPIYPTHERDGSGRYAEA